MNHTEKKLEIQEILDYCGMWWKKDVALPVLVIEMSHPVSESTDVY